jgi:hypothetical protein
MALSTIPFSGLGADASNQGVNFRNLIINGDMSIAQRGTSASSLTVGGYSTQDRWIRGMANAGTWTQSQDTDVPTGQGFAKSLKLDCTTASTPIAAGGNLNIGMRFEGQMLQQLKYGISNAESLTLSFWVKSTKTGTFYAEFYNFDDSRHISKSYTVNVSDTWEKKTITFEGDIAGTITNDNTSSLYLLMWLAAGSDFTSGTHTGVWEATVNANRLVGQVNCADSTSNNFYLTGVQLEVGTSASDFEFLPYDVNLQRCERYYQLLQGFEGSMRTSTGFGCITMFRTQMRSAPSVTQSGALQITDGNADFTQSSTSVEIPASRVTTLGVQLYFVNFTSLTQFRPAGQNTNVNDSKVGADAEL